MKIIARARAALKSLEGAVQYRFAAGGLTEAVSLNSALILKAVGRTLASELTAAPGIAEPHLRGQRAGVQKAA